MALIILYRPKRTRTENRGRNYLENHKDAAGPEPESHPGPQPLVQPGVSGYRVSLRSCVPLLSVSSAGAFGYVLQILYVRWWSLDLKNTVVVY